MFYCLLLLRRLTRNQGNSSETDYSFFTFAATFTVNFVALLAAEDAVLRKRFGSVKVLLIFTVCPAF